jgi:uncharacterized protein YerC
MVRIPRGQFNKAKENELLNLLLAKIRKIDSVGGFKNFINQFLNKEEKTALLRRLAVVDLISRRKTYREIRNTLEISSGTISNVKDILAGRGYNRKLPKKKTPESKAPIRSRRRQIPLMPPITGRGRWRFLNRL